MTRNIPEILSQMIILVPKLMAEDETFTYSFALMTKKENEEEVLQNLIDCLVADGLNVKGTGVSRTVSTSWGFVEVTDPKDGSSLSVERLRRACENCSTEKAALLMGVSYREETWNSAIYGKAAVELFSKDEANVLDKELKDSNKLKTRKKI